MSKNHTEDKMIYANDSVVALDQAGPSAPLTIPPQHRPCGAYPAVRRKFSSVITDLIENHAESLFTAQLREDSRRH
jgi:hypothetical protein